MPPRLSHCRFHTALPSISLLFPLTSPCSAPRRYDIKWIQVCADEVTKFQDMGVGSKPLIILYKMGLECGKMDKGADGNVLQRLVDANKGDKQA